MTKNESWGWVAFFAGIVCVLCYAFSNIVTPFIFGAILAYVFAPVIEKLERFIPRTLSSAFITLTFVFLFVFLVISIAPKIEHKLAELISLLPEYSEHLIRSINTLLSELNLEEFDITSIRSIILKNVDVIIGVVLKIFTHSNAITSFFSYLIIIPVTMFYLMRDWNNLTTTITHCIPYRFVGITEDLSHRIRACLWQFFKGQMGAACLLAAYYSFCLFSLSLSYGIVLGIITGLMSFIPFIGAICCGITAFIIGIVSEFSVGKLFIIAAIYTIGPLLESYVITPRFVGDKVGLHPLWILFAFFAGIQIYGILGVAIAIPCASVLAEIVKYLAQRAQNSVYFKA